MKYFLKILFALSLFWGNCLCSDKRWDHEEELKETVYIFACGLNMCPPIHAAPYTKDSVSLPHLNEKVRYSNGIDILRKPYLIHFPEVEFYSIERNTTGGIKGFLKNIFLTVFTWNNISTQIYRCIKKLKGEQKSSLIIIPKNQPRLFSLHKYHLIITNINYGQEKDIASIQRALNALNTYPRNAVFMGSSRGARALYSYFSHHSEDLQKFPGKKVAIFEGPFYSFHSTIKDKYSYLSKIPFFINIIHKMFELFTSYKHDKESAEKLARIYPKNIPLLIVTSKVDDMVPHKNMLRLAQDLVGQECEVNIVCLEHATHSRYPREPRDQERYQAAVHAFYKKYHLPHDSSLADKGKQYLLEKEAVKEYVQKILNPQS